MSVRDEFAGEWQANTNYYTRQSVTYQGGLYRAAQDHVSGSSFNSGLWVALSLSAASAVPTVDSGVPMNASNTYLGGWIDLGASGTTKTVQAVAETDQAGTFYLEDSQTGDSLTPADLRRLATTLTGTIRKATARRYIRFGYVNGPTAQTIFELNYTAV